MSTNNDDDDGGRHAKQTAKTVTSITCPLNRMLLEAEPTTSSLSSTTEDSATKTNPLTFHWRDIKKNTELRTFFNKLASQYNRHLESTLLSSYNKTDITTTQSSNNHHQSTHDNNTTSNGNSNNTINTLLPTIFWIKDDKNGDDNINNKDSFCINTPLAKQPGQFRVVINRDTIRKS